MILKDKKIMYAKCYRETVLNGNLENKLKLYKESVNSDHELRNLFMNDRNNAKLSDNCVGLTSVYDNFDIFKKVKFSKEEESEIIILTKDMESFSEEDDFCIVSQEEFHENFEIFTEGILECMDWDNLFLAGGSVLAMLSKFPQKLATDDLKRKFYQKKYPKSDLDLYIYGLNDYDATKKVYQIYENIKKVLSCDCTCIRSGRAISIVSQFPYRHVQVIIRLHKNLAEVLHSFDIDSCSVGFDGKKVWCTSRAHYAIINKRNYIDLSRRSLAYEYRLKKYNERGYGVAIPNFDKNKVDYRIFVKSPTQLTGLARLLILENINDNVKHNLYRDVLNMHQITMYKNIALATKYEESDYSLVFLPWGPNWDSKKIISHMQKKNKYLNNGDVNYPRYLCFTGTIYEVVKDNGIKKPVFENIIDEQSYMNKFTYGKLKWNYCMNNENKLLGSFNTISSDINSWYNDAYNINDIDLLTTHISKNEKKLAEEIIKKQSDETLSTFINSKDVSCRNPLQMAIMMNDIDMCKILLNNGANPMAITKLNKNSLHKVCEIGNLEILKLMLQFGQKLPDFNVHIKDSYGLIPIMYALVYGHFDCFQYLYETTVENNASLIWFFKLDKSLSNRALHLCLLFKRYDIANYLLSKGYDIHDYHYEDIKTFKNDNKDHIIRKAIVNCDLQFIKLLIQKNGLNEYKQFVDCGSQLIDKIKVTKNTDQKKHFIDTLYYVTELNKNWLDITKLLHYFACQMEIDNLEYLIEIKKSDINCILKNETILDIITNELNITFKQRIEILAQNKLSKLVNNVNETFNEKLRVISTNRDAALLSINEENNWLVKKNNIKTIALEKLDTVEKKITKLEKLRMYLISKNAKSFKDINGIMTTTPIKKKNEFKVIFDSPIYNLYFEDLDNNVMHKTEKYIQLYSAIKKGDLDTIKNLTIKANVKEAIHLCVVNNRKFAPLDIALKYNLELVKPIIEIMNIQMFKEKENSKKKYSKTKLYLDNKNLDNSLIETKHKLLSNDKKINNQSLYGEGHLNADNKLAITELGLNDLFEKQSFLNYYNDSYDALKILIELDNPILNKNIYVDISRLISETSNIDCRNLIINKYSKLLNDSDFKYNLPNKFSSNLIIKSKSIELLHYFTNDCKKIWESSVVNYPFDDLFSEEENILHMVCSIENKNDNDNVDGDYSNLIFEIIKMNPDCINKRDTLNRTPLMITVEKKNSKIFKILLGYQNQHFIEDRYNNGYNMMHMIVHNNDNEMISLLNLETTLNLINSKTLEKLQTPLMIAIKMANIGMAEYLIKLQVKQATVDVFGNTALHYAMMNSLYPIVKLLDKHCKENYFRMTPQDYTINLMKSLFHHNRNDKLNKSLNSKQLYYAIGIYNDFILNKNIPREFTDDENIKLVNDFILSKIKKVSDGKIPDILKI